MEWELKRLDELGFVGRGRSRHRPRGDQKLYGGNYPFIQTGDVQKAEFYINDYDQTYSDFGFEQSKLWKKGTLCISIVGANTAASAILGIDACFPDSVIGFIADKEKANTVFVKYYLDTIKVEMKTIAEGAARENLSMEKLLFMKLKVPRVDIQNKIASILSAYDELIENNKQRIKLLEEMAEEIYKEWFVRLRFPNYENTEFVDGLPKGWEEKPFDEVADYINGYAFKPSDWNDIGLPIIKIAELKNGITDNTPRNEGLNVPLKLHVKHGELLFSWSADLNVYIWNEGEGLLNQHIFKVIPFKIVTKEFLFYCLKHHMSTFKNMSNGATMHHIRRSALGEVLLSLPVNSIIEKFTTISGPMLEEVGVLKQKNQLLQQTRDLLLPRLISGKLSVEGLAKVKAYVLGQNAEQWPMAAETEGEYHHS